MKDIRINKQGVRVDIKGVPVFVQKIVDAEEEE